MTVSQRDKRALILLAMAVIMVAIYVATAPKGTGVVVAPRMTQQSVPASEQRLTRMRLAVAQVPGKEALLKQAKAELADREKNLFEADTAAQATEQLLQVVRSVARAQAPPVDVRGVELGQPKSFGDSYGEVTVAVAAECRIDQLVNMMADLANRKELISTRDLRISMGNPKEKTIGMRLTVAGVVPRKLVPQRKEGF